MAVLPQNATMRCVYDLRIPPTQIKKDRPKGLSFFMGWVMGFEPTNTGTTIRCLRPLGDTHHILLLNKKWHARRDSNP